MHAIVYLRSAVLGDQAGVGDGQDLLDLHGVCYEGLPGWCGLRVRQTWTPVPQFALEESWPCRSMASPYVRWG